MERPNTVSGLMAKRAELMARLDEIAKEARQLQQSIDALEATIRLFGGDVKGLRRPRRRLVARTAQGSMQRHVLDSLRQSLEPLTSLQLAQTFNRAHGLKMDDASLAITRKKVGQCLNNLQRRGLVVSGAGDGDYKGWRIKV